MLSEFIAAYPLECLGIAVISSVVTGVAIACWHRKSEERKENEEWQQRFKNR